MSIKSISSVILIAVTLALGGCVTPGMIGPTAWIVSVETYLSRADLEGRDYVFVVDSRGIDNPAPLAEMEPILEELEFLLARRGFTRSGNLETSDYTIFVAAGYWENDSYVDRPVYSGGEREYIELERQVPRYNRRGQYVGTRTEYDHAYYTTPRVQTGVERVRRRDSFPMLALGIERSGVRFELPRDRRTADPKFRPSGELLYLGTARMPATTISLLGAARCLMESLTTAFPEGGQPLTHSVPNRLVCSLERERQGG